MSVNDVLSCPDPTNYSTKTTIYCFIFLYINYIYDKFNLFFTQNRIYSACL